MLNRTVALLFVAGLAFVCAGPIAEDHKDESIEPNRRYGNGRIIGGETAEPGQFLYQVSLRWIPYTSHFCGGAIIAERWVLTTTICMDHNLDDPHLIYVVTAADDFENTGIEYAVDRIVSHEDFNYDTLENDIALVKTALAFVFNERVAIIPFSSRVIGAGVQSRFSGWGLIDENIFESSESLQYLDLVTLTNIDCMSRHTIYAVDILEGNLCAYSMQRERGLCFYDEGGPLTNNGELVGLYSWNYRCAAGRPDVFVRVSHYYDWITLTMWLHE